jgi:hypothetical protein
MLPLQKLTMAPLLYIPVAENLSLSAMSSPPLILPWHCLSSKRETIGNARAGRRKGAAGNFCIGGGLHGIGASENAAAGDCQRGCAFPPVPVAAEASTPVVFPVTDAFP